MSFIDADGVVYEYVRRDENGNEIEPIRALNGVNLKVSKGDFIAILGGNGSGKSTFAKHLNALLTPNEGTVLVSGIDTKDYDKRFEIRKKAGMVFQNPDNQMVASVVDEEVAFGPENLGIPTKEIRRRVDNALTEVGMIKYKDTSPIRLSGGQKQRIAIAGILAMEPECIILDEVTAMLDPQGRKDVLNVLDTLNKEKGVTIIMITHNMEEVSEASYIFVMDKGQIALEGTPKDVFSEVDKMKELRLDVPVVTMIAHELRRRGIELKDGIITNKEFTDEISRIRGI